MPDNAGYYHAAYIVAAVLYTGYVVSLLIRAARINRQPRDGLAHRERIP